MEDPTQKAENQDIGNSRKKWRRLLPLIIRRLVQTLLVIFLLPVLIFQIPWVQNKAAQKLTAYLSKEWNTTVSVGKVHLGILNKINLDNFYLEDLSHDTLMYAGALEIRHSGVFDLLLRKFKIESLQLTDATVNISRKVNQKDFNYQFIADYFSPKKQKEKSEKPPFQFDLRHLYLDRVHFVKPDAVKGELFDVYLAHAEGHFNDFDLAGKQLHLSDFELDNPNVKITLTTAFPLPPTKLPVVNVAEESSSDTAKLVIQIDNVDLSGGRFSLRNLRNEPQRLTPENLLNYNYLDILDIEVHFNDFRFSDLEFAGEVEKISLRDTTGFILENLSAKQAALSCRGMELYDVNLKTPYTELGDTLIFRYSGSYTAWEDFVNEVKMEGRFHNSQVALQDIMKFAPALENNPFFKENKYQVVNLDGTIKGPVNRLDGKNLKINMADGLDIEGSFSTLNLAVPDEQFLHLNLKQLHTNVRTLKKLIPKFNPPPNFEKLGNLDFSGKFDGFFVDFVADGKLKTDIGRAEMFMNLKLREGKEKARYSGDLYLYDFNLGAWTDNSDFGKVTLGSHVKKGVGLTLNTVSAELEGVVDSLVFKGYKYRNANIKGQLQRNSFMGDFSINDGNIDLVFGGNVNFTDSLPSFDFKANVKKLDMRPLNLTSKDLQFFGNVDMKLVGKRLSDIMGTAQVTDFQIVKNRKDSLSIDSAMLTSGWLLDRSEKVFTLKSSLGDLSVNGVFDIEKIPAQISNFVYTNYPHLAERLKLKIPEPVRDTAKFDFNFQVYQLQNLVNFFEEDLKGFDASSVKGNFDGFANKANIEVEVPAWEYQNIKFKDVYLRSKLNGPEGSVQIGVIETAFSETQKLSPVSIIGSIYTDTLEFLLISSNFYKILDNININGVLSLQGDDAYRISFKPSDLVVLNETWQMDTDNYLEIGNGKVETENFMLTSGKRSIKLNSVRNEGLELELENYPIDSLEFIREIKKHTIGGIADLTAKVKNVFKFEGLSALLRIDSLKINGDDYGVLRVDASANSPKETITATLSIEGDTSLLTADGYFNPPGFVATSKRKWIKNEPLYFDFNIDIEKYPVKIVNYFVPEVLNPKGSLSATGIHFSGVPSMPDISGNATVSNVEFTIKPLQVTYRIPEGQVAITNRIFDAKDTWVYDRFNNKAQLDGGITHDHLKNFGLDLTIRTEAGRPFLGLETTERDNPIFYGRALGTGYVRFTGSFAQPSLYVSATTSELTEMHLPMTGTTVSNNNHFIEFTKPTLETETGGNETESAAEARGLNMLFDVDITPVAKMEVIFDRAWGDKLEGTGSGSLLVSLDRHGAFDMSGTYTVETGNYLFTLMKLGLNKPFVVEPGGTISWSGNPYEAVINIDATYSGLSTSVYSFIAEYLTTTASQEAQDIARNSTPVNLTMQLTGQLLKPDIAFDISFPNLDSELKNYAESKMRTVRLDPNELNRQVFGLLMLGQFLPSGYTIQAGDVGINTVSEMLSNQLSIYFTDFIMEFLTGKKLIQGIDFDISYNRYTSNNFDPNNPTTSYTNNELRTRLKVIVNDRISVQAGGNFGNEAFTGNNGVLGGEFTIEYVLTKDRRLKLKAYGDTEADFTGGFRKRGGIALNYKREFDSFSELFEGRKKKQEQRKLKKAGQ
ncbi:MAG: hypothetical protein GC192_18695 [Bacteroidetes bacterium]|nr:hypothetical protein [Bacteroidota bacterium]